jgi:hypothetical protein
MPSAPGALVKLVFDTNILVSGFLWHGPPARLISAALQGRAQIFVSLTILLEFRETLKQPKFASRLAAQKETAETLARTVSRPLAMKQCPRTLFRLPNFATAMIYIFSPAPSPQTLTPSSRRIKDLLVMKIPIIDASEALIRLGIA